MPAFEADAKSGIVPLALKLAGQNETFAVSYATEASLFQVGGAPVRRHAAPATSPRPTRPTSSSPSPSWKNASPSSAAWRTGRRRESRRTEIEFREASDADMPGISHVRLSVIENALSVEQLEERGITNASVAASLLTHRKGWVAEQDGRIVAFSMADRADWSIFALFVLPGYEQRGLGSRLLDLALDWLWEQRRGTRLALDRAAHAGVALLRAARMGLYRQEARGDLRFELSRPVSPT